ncbi:MAG: IS30 family transposase [Saprospiraceae bacterium]|nr:IS30 family transposase [Saprospiraceae bacterium]
MSGIREALRVSVPYSGRKTITFDRGSEFMAHTMLVEYLNVKSYYCEPRSPWQKGTVENTNGRLRKFIPRSTNVNLLTIKIYQKSAT